MKKTIFGSFLSWCVGLVVLFAGSLAAQQGGPPAGGVIGAFVLAVDEENAGKGPDTKQHEPDVTRHGGKVVGSRSKYRFIELPIAAARALCAERGVAFMQRVWMGEPYESRGEAPCARPKAAAAVATTGVEDDLIWETGTYLYDGSGNIRKIGTDTYSYDSAGRLISATVGGKTENYRYDSFGNLVEKSIVGQTPGPIAVDSSSNRLLGVTYDVVGNVVTRGLNVHTYDSVGMQDSVQEPMNTVRFLYTADEERIVTWRNETEARITVRDFGGKVLRELSAGGNLNGIDTWVWEQDYVYGAGQLLGADREVSYGGRRHFHLDHLGSVRMITDESGLRLGRHDYYPFGVERTSPVQEVTNFGYDRPIAMKYTSHERDFRWLNADHTDYLDYMHARYYDPGLGRFLSVDPVMDLKKTMSNPQSWNRYAYVINNPLRYTDPTGETWRESFLMGWDWLTGRGEQKRKFSQGSNQVDDMKDAPKVAEARKLFYSKNAKNIADGQVLQPVTNYRGSFGVRGVVKAKTDPTEQFVGSYRIDITPTKDGLRFELNNTSSFKSLAYGVAPDWERSSLRPMGNMEQTYTWVEPYIGIGSAGLYAQAPD